MYDLFYFYNMLKKYLPLVPVVFLIFTLKFTILQGLYFWGFEFPFSVYFGLLALLINLYVFFNHRTLYKYVLFMTIILGNTSLLRFTFSEYHSFLSIGSLKFAFNPIMLFVAILTYTFNYTKCNEFLARFISTSPISDTEYKQLKSVENIQKYTQTFISFDNERLLKIMNDKRYTEDAQEAATKIYQLKNKKDPQ